MGFHLPLYFLFLFLLCPILQAAEFQEPTCGKEVCGNITIPSPFGIHNRCYTHPSFSVTCNQTLNGEKPFINVYGIDLESMLNNINCNKASVSVDVSGTPFFCSSDMNYFGSVGCENLATILSNGLIHSAAAFNQAMYPDSKRCASAFIFSLYSSSTGYSLPSGINNRSSHVPAVLSWNSTYCGEGGCGNLVTTYGNETDNLISGFLQPSCRINNKTSSIIGCPLIIPEGLSSFFANMSTKVDSSDYRRKRSCRFVSLTSYDYVFPDDFDTSNKTCPNATAMEHTNIWRVPFER
ncbi:hypothetical protein Goshw_002869 [Gossypium schwendimanii]|uniref:Wall-associated receptor kinase galacturonan-binding domain-containing protein n=1 Tax=Gossypium schwendimanii TaxID=34291 RepID=A0A7J9ND95_GOSSC|nr:hypothetical protein [Gossypium schwendimanii]